MLAARLQQMGLMILLSASHTTTTDSTDTKRSVQGQAHNDLVNFSY